MKYKTSKNLFDFQKFQTIRSFDDSIPNGQITISETDEKQSHLLNNILEFYDKARPKSKAENNLKSHTYEGLNALPIKY